MRQALDQLVSSRLVPSGILAFQCKTGEQLFASLNLQFFFTNLLPTLPVAICGQPSCHLAILYPMHI